MAFAKELKVAQKYFEDKGHVCIMPDDVDGYVERDEDIKGAESARKKKARDLIRRFYKLIEKSDILLALNYDKKGIKNYIGGNTFLEIGFAHVLHKPIYLLNPIPNISYADEIIAMSPIVLGGDLTKLPEH